jgi:hypothetical protein
MHPRMDGVQRFFSLAPEFAPEVVGLNPLAPFGSTDFLKGE